MVSSLPGSPDSLHDRIRCFPVKISGAHLPHTIPFADIPAFCNKDLEPIKTLLTPYLPQDIAYDCVNYCTEASFLQKLGPTVVLGPGSIDQAHGIDEYVALSELTKCDDFLCKLITSFKPRT